MRDKLDVVLGLLLAGGVAVVLATVVSSGCVYERCDCPCLTDGGDDGGGNEDGGEDGGDCVGPPEETAPRALIQSLEAPGNYVTIRAGDTVDFAAALDPEWEVPMDCLLPISYRWDFGNGQTSDEQAPGAIAFASPGFYTVSMTATNSRGTADLLPDAAYVSIWSGTVFEDDFEGNPFDWDGSGWARRVSDMIHELNPYFAASPMWTVVPHAGGHRLYSGDWGSAFEFCQPASQGMLARLAATSARLSVRQYRQDPPEGSPHFSDIILRYNYVRLGTNNAVSSFYRARIQEITEAGQHCICLDAFEIDGEDEAGTGMNGSELNGCGNRVCDYPGDSFFVTVEITGTASQATITVAIAADPRSGPTFASATFTDTTNPRPGPGLFGISQCVGETYFDDFRFERLD